MPGRVTSSGRMSLSHKPPSGSATFRRKGRSSTLLGRQPRIALDPAASALAEAGLGGSDTLGMVATELHIHSHLLVGGGASGHVGPRLEIEDPTLPAHTQRPETTEIRAARFGPPTTGLCPL